MSLRVGLVTCAHLHVWSYVSCLAGRDDASIIGIWDHDAERGRAFAEKANIPYLESYESLLDACDAVAIVSENALHAQHILQAVEAGKHVLCEKPLVIREEDGPRVVQAAEKAGVVLMTAFPCRFSPAYQSLKARVAAGEIGAVRAIAATNRGRCPFGWFVEPEKSGGGAMIDHVVHVMDLLRDLLGEEPMRVQAQTGNNMYEQAWDDTAMVTIEFPSGVFATLDSSWSRPSSFRTWGDVTMNVIGDAGMIELDMFGTAVQHYHEGSTTHTEAFYGSNFDALMVEEFLAACREGRPPLVTGYDGFRAAQVAIVGYRSVSEGQPVAVAT
jgi:predicted dehydrogenase